MAALVDGFVALPGGLGTLEETFEILTWAQLGIHAKPIGVLNVAGYWDDLIRFLAPHGPRGFLAARIPRTDSVRLDAPPRCSTASPPGSRRRSSGSGSGRPRPSSAAPAYAGPHRTLADGVIHSYPQLGLRRG